MMRTLSLLLLLSLFALAQEEEKAVPDAKQIAWVGDWDEAFQQAKAEKKPVMVCINSLDGEGANQRAATKIYRDPAFVKETRGFVMIIVSTLGHRSQGDCPRFGKVTCQQHADCYKELSRRHGETFLSKKEGMKMISPQHAWFRPDGSLIRRKEYELTQAEIVKRMRTVLAEVTGKPVEGEGDPEGGPADDRQKPLNERDKAELERVEATGKDKEESRRAAMANLLATGKLAAINALMELLPGAKQEVKCDLLRAFGEAQILDALDGIHERLEKDKDELVRSFAAVATERIGNAESIPVLIRRLKKERDTAARRNVARALGVCGGGVADKDAAKALLKAISSDKQVRVRQAAAIACKAYGSEEGKKLVVKKLEALAKKLKDDNVRGAVVYTLSYIGSEETTLPIFEKIMEKFEKSKDRWRVSFMRSAIKILKGEGDGFGRSAWFLFRGDRDDPARS